MRIKFTQSIVVDRIEFKSGDEVEVNEKPKDGEQVDITRGQLESLLSLGFVVKVAPGETVAKSEVTSTPAKKEPAKN